MYPGIPTIIYTSVDRPNLADLDTLANRVLDLLAGNELAREVERKGRTGAKSSWCRMVAPEGRMFLMCLANSVFPEQLAPLQISMCSFSASATYPIPTSTTLRLRLMLNWIDDQFKDK
jgi:hypothetical protein